MPPVVVEPERIEVTWTPSDGRDPVTIIARPPGLFDVALWQEPDGVGKPDEDAAVRNLRRIIRVMAGLVVEVSGVMQRDASGADVPAVLTENFKERLLTQNVELYNLLFSRLLAKVKEERERGKG